MPKINCYICEKERECLPKEKFEDSGFYECSACGVNFIYPLKMVFQDYYEELYGENSEGYGDNKQEYWEFFKQAKEFSIGKKILEIGCGPGHFLKLAKERGFEVYGIDFNSLAINSALKKGLGNVKLANIKDLLGQFPNIKFDAVVLFNIIEHYCNPNKLFEHINRVLEPGGFAIINTPNSERTSLKLNFRKRREGWDYPPHHLIRWNKNSLAGFLINRGFNPVFIEEEKVRTLGQASDFSKNILQLSTSTLLVTKIKKEIASSGNINPNTSKRKFFQFFLAFLKFIKSLMINILAFIILPFVYLASKFFVIKGTNLYVLAKKT